MKLRLTGLENPMLAATVGLLASYSSRFAASNFKVCSIFKYFCGREEVASFKESNFIQGVTMCHTYSTLRRFAFQNLRGFKAINSGYTAAQYSSIPPKNCRRTTPPTPAQKT